MRVICAVRGPDAITAILAAVDADEWADGPSTRLTGRCSTTPTLSDRNLGG